MRFREAELAHGRVAMIAGLGFLVQENLCAPHTRRLIHVCQTTAIIHDARERARAVHPALAHSACLCSRACACVCSHPIFPEISGPGAKQLDLVLQTENGQAVGATLLFGIWLTEIARARIGWKAPEDGIQELRADYTPGDLGFDPLGMTAKMDEAEMLNMRNKELNNGRLAMIAIAGICAQEVISGTELLGSA